MKKTRLLLFLSGVFFVAFAAQLYFSPDVNGKEDNPSEIWLKRCEKGTDQCEIFQSLSLKESGQRLIEFAVGFSPEEQGAARAVAVLPLGILLDRPVGLEIDSDKKFQFTVRQCLNSGCYGFINMNEALLSAMRKGDKMTIVFTSVQGKTLRVEMSLKGFTKALKSLG